VENNCSFSVNMCHKLLKRTVHTKAWFYAIISLAIVQHSCGYLQNGCLWLVTSYMFCPMLVSVLRNSIFIICPYCDTVHQYTETQFSILFTYCSFHTGNNPVSVVVLVFKRLQNEKTVFQDKGIAPTTDFRQWKRTRRQDSNSLCTVGRQFAILTFCTCNS